jgi:hypothetical protein
MAELTCPACKQSFQVPGAGNMQDALDVIEAHAGAHPGHLRAAATAGDTRRLDAIRGVLDRFDWEHDDRQLALEAIERIADGGQQ